MRVIMYLTAKKKEFRNSYAFTTFKEEESLLSITYQSYKSLLKLYL